MTPELVLVERLNGTTVILAVRGIVDMAAAPTLADQIGAILRRRPPAVVIDFSDVSFLATAGMSVLMEASRRSEELAISFALVADGPVTVRPMQLLGIDDLLAIHPTVEAALRAVSAEDNPARDDR